MWYGGQADEERGSLHVEVRHHPAAIQGVQGRGQGGLSKEHDGGLVGWVARYQAVAHGRGQLDLSVNGMGGEGLNVLCGGWGGGEGGE